MFGRIVFFIRACVAQKMFWRVLILVSASVILLYLHSCRACACVTLYVLLSLTIMTELAEEISATTSLIPNHVQPEAPDVE